MCTLAPTPLPGPERGSPPASLSGLMFLVVQTMFEVGLGPSLATLLCSPTLSFWQKCLWNAQCSVWQSLLQYLRTPHPLQTFRGASSAPLETSQLPHTSKAGCDVDMVACGGSFGNRLCSRGDCRSKCSWKMKVLQSRSERCERPARRLCVKQ